MKRLLRRLAGRCDIHDRPSPLIIAQLEQELGIDPDAMAKLFQGDLVANFSNPRLIDCGRQQCRRNR